MSVCVCLADGPANILRHERSVHKQVKAFQCAVPGCLYRSARSDDVVKHYASKKHARDRLVLGSICPYIKDAAERSSTGPGARIPVASQPSTATTTEPFEELSRPSTDFQLTTAAPTDSAVPQPGPSLPRAALDSGSSTRPVGGADSVPAESLQQGAPQPPSQQDVGISGDASGAAFAAAVESPPTLAPSPCCGRPAGSGSDSVVDSPGSVDADGVGAGGAVQQRDASGGVTVTAV